jgi:hypothetical protein
MSDHETHPASNGVAVTKSDTTDLGLTRALYVGGTGDVVVRFNNSTSVTFSAVPAGTILPIRVNRVMAATSATLIVALY